MLLTFILSSSASCIVNTTLLRSLITCCLPCLSVRAKADHTLVPRERLSRSQHAIASRVDCVKHPRRFLGPYNFTSTRFKKKKTSPTRTHVPGAELFFWIPDVAAVIISDERSKIEKGILGAMHARRSRRVARISKRMILEE